MITMNKIEFELENQYYIEDINAVTHSATVSIFQSKAAISSIIMTNSVIVCVITYPISNFRGVTTIPLVIIAHFNVMKEAAETICNNVIPIWILIAAITTIKMTNMIVIYHVTLTICNQIFIWATVTIIIVAYGMVIL